MKILEPYGLILIAVLALILFGPKRLPDLGRSFGRTMKAFREGVEEDAEESRGEGKAEVGQEPSEKRTSPKAS